MVPEFATRQFVNNMRTTPVDKVLSTKYVTYPTVDVHLNVMKYGRFVLAK